MRAQNATALGKRTSQQRPEAYLPPADPTRLDLMPLWLAVAVAQAEQEARLEDKRARERSGYKL